MIFFFFFFFFLFFLFRFPHKLKRIQNLTIRNRIEVPILDRFFATSATSVIVSSSKLHLPGLTNDDRLEYEKINYPRNSIMQR